MKKAMAASVLLLTGCAAGLNAVQEQELRAYEHKDLAVHEKSEAAAALLGILPGGGSFYTRQYGVGVVNLMLWPFSVLWDPLNANRGAQEINYQATLAKVNQLREKEYDQLDQEVLSRRIDSEQYKYRKNVIERRYAP
jgi:hypothetical protein